MIGIVSGVGPYAGLDLLRKIYDNTIASSDQDHIDTALISVSSQIPDRTEYLLGKVSLNPAYPIAEVIKKLDNLGCKVIGIPCNTAHAPQIFNKILELNQKNNIKAQLLNLVDETIKFIKNNFPQKRKVAILSTTGTYKFKIYYNKLIQNNLEPIIPTEQEQTQIVHPAIYDPTFGIKALGYLHPKTEKALMSVISKLQKQGAELLILACTELSLALSNRHIPNLTLIDPTLILARALIQKIAPHKLKPLKL